MARQFHDRDPRPVANNTHPEPDRSHFICMNPRPGRVQIGTSGIRGSGIPEDFYCGTNDRPSNDTKVVPACCFSWLWALARCSFCECYVFMHDCPSLSPDSCQSYKVLWRFWWWSSAFFIAERIKKKKHCALVFRGHSDWVWLVDTCVSKKTWNRAETSSPSPGPTAEHIFWLFTMNASCIVCVIQIHMCEQSQSLRPFDHNSF